MQGIQDNIETEKMMELTIEKAADDEDFIRCLHYIKLREVRAKMSKEDIADYFEIDYRTLDKWIMKWTKSGLINRCRRIISIPMAEEVRVAEQLVMQDWPKILERQRKIALHSKSDKVSNDTTNWLFLNIIKPKMEEQEDAGLNELEYIKSQAEVLTKFAPLALHEPDSEDSESRSPQSSAKPRKSRSQKQSR